MDFRTPKAGTAVLRAGIDLAAGKAPTEIRLLRAGENVTDRFDTPVFVFDDVAAAMVMQSWRNDGSPRLYGDWNHGMLAESPSREQAASAFSFVPELRDGELWASQIEWTDEGRSDVETRTYNLFSPAFQWECGADGYLRPSRLINFALVNLAGLKDIEPLLAASAAAHQQQETNVEYEKLYTEAKARNVELEAELKAARGASSDVVALGAAVGLTGTAPQAERVAAVTGLVALRTDILKLSGQDSPAAALGTIGAWKTKAEGYDKLAAESAEAATVALRAEIDGVLENGVKEGKVPPALKASLEAAALGMGAGKPSKDGVAWLSAHITGLPKVVETVDGGGKRQPGTGTVALTAVDRQYAKLAGISEEQALKSKQQIADRAAARAAQ